jgi:hypothetical protein
VPSKSSAFSEITERLMEESFCRFRSTLLTKNLSPLLLRRTGRAICTAGLLSGPKISVSVPVSRTSPTRSVHPLCYFSGILHSAREFRFPSLSILNQFLINDIFGIGFVTEHLYWLYCLTRSSDTCLSQMGYCVKWISVDTGFLVGIVLLVYVCLMAREPFREEWDGRGM